MPTIECHTCGHSGLLAEEKCNRCGSIDHILAAHEAEKSAIRAEAEAKAATAPAAPKE
jgi:uncharacterized phosphosugar-binding protein